MAMEWGWVRKGRWESGHDVTGGALCLHRLRFAPSHRSCRVRFFGFWPGNQASSHRLRGRWRAGGWRLLVGAFPFAPVQLVGTIRGLQGPQRSGKGCGSPGRQLAGFGVPCSVCQHHRQRVPELGGADRGSMGLAGMGLLRPRRQAEY
ncbi:hypothetical protein BT67DRAFT_159144 [Trichocladium antarcticum]|uniref:Uncharacterized protein n=1 Tax=Trichocladium antarcticum TaxID=1450529 RepID=A0AAN6UEP1_9PEZI|nr:hypothetical protein BT67DRAFT_159144 [Trichocladium antarcticum]